ncbi:hypothetical protein BC941DRAFT_452597 [Chlamydoabsidia padenii]|nr:hypothetical protein BC941DRAFT_452597 [Chlamydoabsidia padenii]
MSRFEKNDAAVESSWQQVGTTDHHVNGLADGVRSLCTTPRTSFRETSPESFYRDVALNEGLPPLPPVVPPQQQQFVDRLPADKRQQAQNVIDILAKTKQDLIGYNNCLISLVGLHDEATTQTRAELAVGKVECQEMITLMKQNFELICDCSVDNLTLDHNQDVAMVPVEPTLIKDGADKLDRLDLPCFQFRGTVWQPNKKMYESIQDFLDHFEDALTFGFAHQLQLASRHVPLHAPRSALVIPASGQWEAVRRNGNIDDSKEVARMLLTSLDGNLLLQQAVLGQLLAKFGGDLTTAEDLKKLTLALVKSEVWALCTNTTAPLPFLPSSSSSLAPLAPASSSLSSSLLLGRRESFLDQPCPTHGGLMANHSFRDCSGWLANGNKDRRSRYSRCLFSSDRRPYQDRRSHDRSGQHYREHQTSGQFFRQKDGYYNKSALYPKHHNKTWKNNHIEGQSAPTDQHGKKFFSVRSSKKPASQQGRHEGQHQRPTEWIAWAEGNKVRVSPPPPSLVPDADAIMHDTTVTSGR